MLSAENLASIESEGRRLVAAARRDPDRSVPQYPDWTLRDLVSHTAAIHARTVSLCRELPTERVSSPSPPDGADVFDWYEATLDELLAELTAADPANPCWGFVDDCDIGAWERRMVVETGVHRWDALQAFDEEDRLTDHVARSGLDEFASMWLPRLGDVPSIEVRAVDLDQSWVFGVDPGMVVEGSASDIYLRLMSRPSSVELPGEWGAAVDGLAPPPKR